jgi:hypothetical protein
MKYCPWAHRLITSALALSSLQQIATGRTALPPTLSAGGTAEDLGDGFDSPGPVPPWPAVINRPWVSPRLCAGMLLPRIRVMGEATLTFNPAHMVMLPSVVARVASG